MPIVAIAAGLEILTAGVLLLAPTLFAALLFGAELSAAGQAVGRLAGISLISLALACWPRGAASARLIQPVLALLLFSGFCAVFLGWVGISGEPTGVLLWPAAATHAALAGLLLWRWFAEAAA